jgi:hypothetical protein
MDLLLFTTSYLFLIPAVTAFLISCYDVAIACVICWISSITYHTTQHPIARKIDMFTVNTIATLYTIHAISQYRFFKPYIGVIIAALITVLYYIVCVQQCNNDSKKHAWIHLYSNIGIMWYLGCTVRFHSIGV